MPIKGEGKKFVWLTIKVSYLRVIRLTQGSYPLDSGLNKKKKKLNAKK
jgi:hypothetical protein